MFLHFTVLRGGRILDALPPNMALQGTLFVLHALEILRQAEDILHTGTVIADLGSDTHPPITARIEGLKAMYAEHVRGDENPDQTIPGALFPSQTLLLIWNRTKPQFLEHYKTGRQLHPIWKRRSWK